MEPERRGRPQKPEAERRIHSVGFRLTEAEYLEAKRQAEVAGMSLGTWFRVAAMSTEVVNIPKVNRQVWGELGKIGGLLKQLLGELRTGEVSGITTKHLQWLNELLKYLHETRDHLGVKR